MYGVGLLVLPLLTLALLQLSLQELQSSVIAAVAKHFIPDVKKVKGRIEAMVEQEYIERVPEKQNTFRYVA